VSGRLEVCRLEDRNPPGDLFAVFALFLGGADFLPGQAALTATNPTLSNPADIAVASRSDAPSVPATLIPLVGQGSDPQPLGIQADGSSTPSGDASLDPESLASDGDFLVSHEDEADDLFFTLGTGSDGPLGSAGRIGLTWSGEAAAPAGDDTGIPGLRVQPLSGDTYQPAFSADYQPLSQPLVEALAGVVAAGRGSEEGQGFITHSGPSGGGGGGGPNQPPDLQPIADRTVPASQATITVPLVATDPNGDPLTYSATVTSLAYHIDTPQGYNFYADAGGFYESTFGAGEKWVRSDAIASGWALILPNGELRAWDGSGMATGSLLGNVGSFYHADPNRLIDVPTTAYATTSIMGTTLTVTRNPISTISSIRVTATATDPGMLSDSESFNIIVTAASPNQPPNLSPIAGQTIPSSQATVSVPLMATDPDGDPLTLSATATSLAHFLDQQHDFFTSGDFFVGSLGAGEKWVQSSTIASGWAFILPNGELHAWDGSGAATGPLLGNVGTYYFDDPNRLINVPTTAYATTSIMGTTLTVTRSPVTTVSSIRVTATATDPGMLSDSESFNIIVTADGPGPGPLNVVVLGDTNRDGVITDADVPGHTTWTAASGAIFSVNFDDDDNNDQPDAVNFNDSGAPFGENFVIENAADAQELAPVVIRALGPTWNPAVHRVWLHVASVEDIQSIHIFPSNAPGTTAIAGGLGTRIGGATPAQYIDVTSLVSATMDRTFYVEGMFFRHLGSNPANSFDGFVDIAAEIWENDVTLISSDTVRMKVAPWIALPHTQQSIENWAANYGAINAPYLFTASAESGYFGLDASGHLQTIPSGIAGTQWVTDHGEIGYTQRPGGPATQVLFRLPYFRGAGVPQPPWPQSLFLRPNFGTFQIGVNLGADAGDYGGNLEVLPPTPTYPRGRLYVGNTASSSLITFLQSQEVQPVFTLSSSWLIVSHVDEYAAPQVAPGQIALADPVRADELLNSIPVADRGRAVFFATGAMPIDGTVGAGGTATRIFTGMDLTGQNWQYIRIYQSSNPTAAGLVARIAPGGLGNGYVDINLVWATTSNIGDPNAPNPNAVPSHQRWALSASAPTAGGFGGASFPIPQAGDKFVLVEGTRFWSGNTPAFVTVQEFLADTDFRTFNTSTVQAKMNDIRSQFEAAAGPGAGLTFLRMPVFFFGRQAGFDDSRASVAFTPDAANGVAFGNFEYIARQYGPRNAAGTDIFEADVRAAIPSVRFVDTWDLYHRLLGDVDCGVLVARQPFSTPWWMP
jgi:hypothetical protein